MPALASLGENYDYLAPGDILGMDGATGRFRVLFRANSRHNAFLVTERCNNYCVMCSQPPRNVDDLWLLDEIATAIPLLPKSLPSLGFTGGEPLLRAERFIEILHECRSCLPQTTIHVLSNGRAFADPAITRAWAGIEHPNLTVGIPVYSDVAHLHDYVVQAKGAFDETLLGILRLKDKGQRVEIRVVLHAITAPRIVELCSWLARNLPFVDHVALMGLEDTGFAIANKDKLWIDPVDYRDDLAEGVTRLASAAVPVSIYNLPLCLVREDVWPFAVQSISDWKNGYGDSCAECAERESCAGFFTSGRPIKSRGIKPFITRRQALEAPTH